VRLHTAKLGCPRSPGCQTQPLSRSAWPTSRVRFRLGHIPLAPLTRALPRGDLMAVQTSNQNNPAGHNQYQKYDPPYGDIEKQTALTKEAPISGAPFSNPALNLPGRSQDAAQRPLAPSSATRAAPATPAPGASAARPGAGLSLAQAWQAIASVPGASSLVQQFAARAAGAT
jgi:hypothetical protein